MTVPYIVIAVLLVLLAGSVSVNIWLAGTLQEIHDADELDETWAEPKTFDLREIDNSFDAVWEELRQESPELIDEVDRRVAEIRAAEMEDEP